MDGPKTRVADLAGLVDVMVAASAPTTRDNGDALEVDDLWRDTSSQTWNVWDGTAWQPMGAVATSVGSNVVRDAGRWEVWVDDATPPEPLLTPGGTDWVYVWVEG